MFQYLSQDLLTLITSLCETSTLQELMLTCKSLHCIAEAELWSKIVIVGKKINYGEIMAFWSANRELKRPWEGVFTVFEYQDDDDVMKKMR